MGKLIWPLTAVIVTVILAVAGVLVAHSASQAHPAAVIARRDVRRTRPVAHVTPVAPVPSPVKTLVKRRRATVIQPNVTDPWAVVSAYYGDVESHNYREAWALLSSGLVTGQTYQQFVAGYACTGEQQLTDLGETGDQVTFDLSAGDNCTGVTRYYSGTDTVQGGRIVAANVQRTG